MKERFITKSLNFIGKYETIDDLKLLKLKYGLEGLYSLIEKLIVVLIIAGILNTLPETLMIIAFYACLRSFSYGLHAKTNLGCWITSIFLYNIVPLLMKTYLIPQNIGYIVFPIAFLSFLLWAPADTPKRPLIRKEIRDKCKIKSLIIISIYLLLYIFTQNILLKKTIIYAIIIQTIFINPLSYKITKTTFNNYKHYKKNN